MYNQIVIPKTVTQTWLLQYTFHDLRSWIFAKAERNEEILGKSFCLFIQQQRVS